LSQGVRAVWDMSKAERLTTPTRERICINGLWKWQPAGNSSADVPTSNWGYFKVPGCWPGSLITCRKIAQIRLLASELEGSSDAQPVRGLVPAGDHDPRPVAGRRIALAVECLNSLATVFVDGRAAGEIQFPGGELDLTSICQRAAST